MYFLFQIGDDTDSLNDQRRSKKLIKIFVILFITVILVIIDSQRIHGQVLCLKL